MKVWGLYKCEMNAPFWHENLLALFKNESDALAEAEVLNLANQNPLEEDSYGPYSGCEYRVYDQEIKEEYP